MTDEAPVATLKQSTQMDWQQSRTVKGLLVKHLWHERGEVPNMGGGFACLSKFDPGAEYLEFELLGPVTYFVLEGSGAINSVPVGKGDYYRVESGRVTAKAGEAGWLVFCQYSNGLRFVRP